MDDFTLAKFKTVVLNLFESVEIKLVVSLMIYACQWLFQTSGEAIVVVYCLVMLDTMTGIMIACHKGQLSSSGFFRFAAKLLVYLILMATASLVDKTMPIKMAIPLTYSFLAVTEAISIMENLSLLGYPVPSKLLKSLKIMNNKKQP